MKLDVAESIENKQEAMSRHFQIELSEIKHKYESAVTLVTDASKNLGTLFKDKMVKIKTKLSQFFADTDMKVTQNTKDMQ